MSKKMRTQPIRAKVAMQRDGFELRGWLGPGKNSYLWFSVNGHCVGSLEGQPLYRLAKAIVKRFEESQ